MLVNGHAIRAHRHPRSRLVIPAMLGPEQVALTRNATHPDCLPRVHLVRRGTPRHGDQGEIVLRQHRGEQQLIIAAVKAQRHFQTWVVSESPQPARFTSAAPGL